MMRAATSVEPPGGNGTISVIGRDGKLSACAGASASGRSASAIEAIVRGRVRFCGNIGVTLPTTIRFCIFAPQELMADKNLCPTTTYGPQAFMSDSVAR